MFLSKYVDLVAIFMIFGILYSAQSFTEVLELGESQVSGKKDQPEAMTFVSRRPVKMTGTASALELRSKIKLEISSPVFDIVTLNN